MARADHGAMKYLVSVSIGPVQDFIAAARRCRDLWYGSYLLSEVSKAAAKSLRNNGAELIFPFPRTAQDLEPGEHFTVVNRLLATVDTDDPGAIVDQAEQAARARLMEEADERAIRPRLRGTEVDWRRYRTQLGTILEVTGAWTPHTKHGDARRRVEELAAGRKATRAFEYYEGKEGEPKSSLDGVRENVIIRRSPRLYQSNLKDKEWLDGIGVVKRFAEGRGKSSRFESTLDVAAIPYVRGQEDQHDGVTMRRYRQFLRDHDVSDNTYSLLYRHESRQIFDGDEAAAQELEAIRGELKKPQPPYYAFLLGDGDRMGRAIDRIDSERGHQEFSGKLSEFAGAARECIEHEKYQGCAIYCGGDDVMALLPLDRAIECACEINRVFGDTMKGYDVTFSAGLVVAHALEPLSEVREWAAAAEKAAKDPKRGDRNALCVAVYPRSGSAVSTWGKWGELAPLLKDLIGLYVDPKDGLSLGLAHELQDLAERTRGWTELHPVVSKMAAAIARNKDCDAAASLIENQVTSWDSLERLCQVMLAARPFARARKEAETK